jgi:uncharacterized spore protein YtfJ
MPESITSPTKIDRRLASEPVQVDGYSVQPVARLSGRCGAGGNEQGNGAGCHLSVEPIEVVVRTEEDGAEFTLALAEPTAQALRAMASVGMAVAAVSIGLAVLARLRHRRQRSRIN